MMASRVRLLLICGALLAFGIGLMVGRHRLFPHAHIEYAVAAAGQVYTERSMLFGLRPTASLYESRYEGSGVTTRMDRATPGFTLLTGWFDDSAELRLVALDGRVVNRWKLRYSEYFPEPSHIVPASEIPRSDWHVEVHGAWLLPDGSAILNFEHKGTVRLSRCGAVEWRLPRMTHHAISPAADGSMWIPAANYVSGAGRYPHLPVPYYEDTLLKVAAQGRVVVELSILEILFRNNLQGVLHWPRRASDGPQDLTHVNDVEELSSERAAQFPQFAAGDLLVSMRAPHMVFVVDPATLAVKWYQSGPWLAQHDPEFLENGRIRIFSNNKDGTETGSKYGGSTLLDIDPASRAVEYRYGREPGQHFYTATRGKQQALGRHVLVTEANAGRAFEIDETGRIVWEFVNRYDETHSALLTQAYRYPERYFTVSDWACGQDR